MTHEHDYKYNGPHGETETENGKTYNTLYARYVCQNREGHCSRPVMDKLIRKTEVRTK